MREDLWLIIFDCDGTLVDSQALIVSAMQAAFIAAGEAPPERSAIHQVIGLSLHNAIEILGIPAETPQNQLLGQLYKQQYTDLRDKHGHPEPLFEGAADLIGDLAATEHVLLGVATGKSTKGVKSLFERNNWQRHFHTIQTSDTAPSKPHPGMIEAALGETGIDRQRAIMIGDTSFDMEMAANAGTKAIGVSWGYHEEEVLARHNPLHIVHDMQTLKAVISQHTNTKQTS